MKQGCFQWYRQEPSLPQGIQQSIFAHELQPPNWRRKELHSRQNHSHTLPSGEQPHSNGKWPFIVDFPINSMVIFHCYVSSPEGNWVFGSMPVTTRVFQRTVHQWRNLPPNVESHFVHQLTVNRSTTNQWDNQWILIKEMDLAPFLAIHEFTPRIFF